MHMAIEDLHWKAGPVYCPADSLIDNGFVGRWRRYHLDTEIREKPLPEREVIIVG
jgi:hypothetical protein